MLRIGYAQSATDEGFFPLARPRRVERTPHPASLREATLSHKGRGCSGGQFVGSGT